MWKNLHGGTTGFSLLGAWWESPQLSKNLLILSLTKFLSPHIKGSPSPPPLTCTLMLDYRAHLDLPSYG